MMGKHARRTVPVFDAPSKAASIYAFNAMHGWSRHRAPGEADTMLTKWVHVWVESDCDRPPLPDDPYCGHGRLAIEVYR